MLLKENIIKYRTNGEVLSVNIQHPELHFTADDALIDILQNL